MPPDRFEDPLQDLRDATRRLREELPRDGYATAAENRATADEVEALAALLRTLRDLVPAELQHQVTDLLRQVLLVLRALIDWWVERLEAGPAPQPPVEPRVEDIEIS